MKKTIVFITQGGVGGAERVASNIANFLDREQYTVHFVAVCEKLSDIQNIVPSGDEFTHIRIRNIWDFTTLRLIRLLKNIRPDYVFCSAMYLNPRIVLAARYVGGIKIILRNCNRMSHLRWDKKLLIKLTYPLAHTIIAQQEEMGEEIANFIPKTQDRIRVMHNPLNTKSIDLGMEAPNPYGEDNTIKYINVARINPVKGQDILLEAFNIVHQKNPNTSLFILGRTNQDPSYFQKLCNYIKEKHLENAVHFTGHESNPFNWIKYADCFVLSSRNEGLPNCMIEAMYVGVPVVAAECIPIIGRMVEKGKNGYIVPVDNPEAMAEAMEKSIGLQGGLTVYKPTDKELFIQLFK